MSNKPTMDYKAAFLKANEACTAREATIITLQQRLAAAEMLARRLKELADGWVQDGGMGKAYAANLRDVLRGDA